MSKVEVNMPKLYISIMVVVLLSLIFSLVGLLVYITRIHNSQVIVFQKIYQITDQVCGFWRVAAYLFVSVGASSIAIINFRDLSRRLNFKWFRKILLLSLGGLFLGLVVFYANACCDSPFMFHFGFPYGWINGITNIWNSSPTSGIFNLIQNYTAMRWIMVPYNFVADFIFWFTTGFLFFAIRNSRVNPTQKH